MEQSSLMQRDGEPMKLWADSTTPDPERHVWPNENVDVGVDHSAVTNNRR
jgi:hypothetical protein